MKKKAATTKRTALVKGKPDDLAPLIAEVRNLIQSARHAAVSAVNTLQVLTNFEIGRHIVEHEQKGEKRAGYGTELLKQLSARLTEEFGKGFAIESRIYAEILPVWHDRVPQISQQPTGKLALGDFPEAFWENGSLRDFPEGFWEIGCSRDFPEGFWEIGDSAKGPRRSPFTLSWSHYVVLLSIKDPDERGFYEIEATNEGWYDVA